MTNDLFVLCSKFPDDTKFRLRLLLDSTAAQFTVRDALDVFRHFRQKCCSSEEMLQLFRPIMLMRSSWKDNFSRLDLLRCLEMVRKRFYALAWKNRTKLQSENFSLDPSLLDNLCLGRDSIQKLKSEKTILRRKTSIIQGRLNKASVQLSAVQKLSVKRKNLLSSYRKSKSRHTQILGTSGREKQLLSSRIDQLLSEKLALQRDLTHAQFEIDRLRNLLVDPDDSSVLVTRDSSGYIPEIRLAVMEFSRCNVGIDQIPLLLESIPRIIFRRSLSDIPSGYTIRSMIREGGVLASIQAAESCVSSENNCLRTDGTSKNSGHFLAMVIQSNNGSMLIGMDKIIQETGETVAQTQLMCIRRISNLYSQLHSTLPESYLTFEKILFHIRGTNTDRGSPEIKASGIIRHKRSELALPVLFPNFGCLSPDEQEHLEKFFTTHCFLHSLTNMASAIDRQVICSHEKRKRISKSGFRESQSATSSTLRRFHKLAYKLGTGDPERLADFVRSRGMEFSFVRQSDTRFNCIFHNGGSLYYLAGVVTEFLEIPDTSSLNKMKKELLEDLSSPVILSSCRCLGLVGFFVTTPLLSLFQNSSVSFVEAGSKIPMILEKLGTWEANPLSVLVGDCGDLLPEFPVNMKSPVLSSLLTPSPVSEIETNCELLLKQMLSKVIEVLRSIGSQFLPGGELEFLDSATQELLRNFSCNNSSCERAFSYLDRYVSSCASVSAEHSFSVISLSTNDTISWALSHPEFSRLMNFSRKTARRSFLVESSKHRELSAARMDLLRQKKELVIQTEQARAEKHEKLHAELEKFDGLWETVQQTENFLVTHLSDQKFCTEALKAQLRYRKAVNRGSGKLYTITRKSLHDLRVSLLQILFGFSSSQSFSSAEISVSPHLLIGKRILHCCEDADFNEVFYSGTIVGNELGSDIFHFTYHLYSDELFQLDLGSILDDIKSGDLLVEF